MQSTPYTGEQIPTDNRFAAQVRITLTDGCVRGIIHDANLAPLYATIRGFENWPMCVR